MPKIVDASHTSIPLETLKQHLKIPAEQNTFMVTIDETVYCDHQTFEEMMAKYKKKQSFHQISIDNVYHDGLNRHSRRAMKAKGIRSKSE